MMQYFGIHISQITYAELRNTKQRWNASFHKHLTPIFKSPMLWLHKQLKLIMPWATNVRCDLACGSASLSECSHTCFCAGVPMELTYTGCQLFLFVIVCQFSVKQIQIIVSQDRQSKTCISLLHIGHWEKSLKQVIPRITPVFLLRENCLVQTKRDVISKLTMYATLIRGPGNGTKQGDKLIESLVVPIIFIRVVVTISLFITFLMYRNFG